MEAFVQKTPIELQGNRNRNLAKNDDLIEAE